jgi:hypothetical protein
MFQIEVGSTAKFAEGIFCKKFGRTSVPHEIPSHSRGANLAKLGRIRDRRFAQAQLTQMSGLLVLSEKLFFSARSD